MSKDGYRVYCDEEDMTIGDPSSLDEAIRQVTELALRDHARGCTYRIDTPRLALRDHARGCTYRAPSRLTVARGYSLPGKGIRWM